MAFSSKPYGFCLLILLAFQDCIAQCIIEKGPPPESSHFKTGGDGPGYKDRLWMVSTDSINGEYKPAIIMDSLPSVYYSSSDWISLANPGEHTGDRFFYFKTTFELPCKNLCDVSYNKPYTFCLGFDIYVDNSIYEIYVNGIPQSNYLDKIPFDNPFHPENHSPNSPINVELCQNWQAGTNTLIIVVASSPPILGLMIMESAHPPFPPGTDTLLASICQGETYLFNNRQLNSSGFYWYKYTNASGCDSLKVLKLNVNPIPSTTISTSICKGEEFEGYSMAGMYRDVFTSSNGCDSIRILDLAVNETPDPDLGNKTAICNGDSIILSPGRFLNYQWQDGSTNDHYVVKRAGFYSVIVSNGCYMAKKEIRIMDGICQIRFPNAFSPNGDGKNEIFRTITDLQLPGYHLVVFNRWGQKIFESADPYKGWDGNFNGSKQPVGVYVWNCSFINSGTVLNKKGIVVLNR